MNTLQRDAGSGASRTSWPAGFAVEGTVDGAPSSHDVRQLELDSARRALAVIKRRLSPDVMESLLADDLERADAQWRRWAAESDGTWHGRDVRISVSGLSCQVFVDWWATALDDLHGVMYPSYPEHYRFGWVPNPSGEGDVFVVVEEVGHEPFRMYCSFGPQWAPVATSPGFELLSSGVGRLLDGTDVVRLMNEIKPTSDGFELKLGFFVQSHVPQTMTGAHVEQQMVEWGRWVEMARAHASAGDARTSKTG